MCGLSWDRFLASELSGCCLFIYLFFSIFKKYYFHHLFVTSKVYNYGNLKYYSL